MKQYNLWTFAGTCNDPRYLDRELISFGVVAKSIKHASEEIWKLIDEKDFKLPFISQEEVYSFCEYSIEHQFQLYHGNPGVVYGFYGSYRTGYFGFEGGG